MALRDYKHLLRDYLAGSISTEDFARQFFALTRSERTWLGKARRPLSDLFAALDEYPTTREGGGVEVASEELHDIVQRVSSEIEQVDDRQTRRFDNPEQVVVGLTDANPEIRAFAAVTARYLPTHDSVIEALRRTLGDHDRMVAGKAAESLSVLGDVESIRSIVDRLEGAEPGEYTPEAWAAAHLARSVPEHRRRVREALINWARRQGYDLDDVEVRPLLAMLDVADGAN